MLVPRTRITRQWRDGRHWWVVDHCRCYGRDPHTHRRYSANSVWVLVRVARDWHDRRHPKPSPAGITNDEAVRMYGTPDPERIN